MLPLAVTLMVVAPLSAPVVARIGTRHTVVSGLVILAVAMTVLSRVGATTGYLPVAIALFLIAVGLGLTTAP